MEQYAPKKFWNIWQGEKINYKQHLARWPGNRNLRIAPDDDRIAVMTGMAPAPDGGFAHHHEGCDFVKKIVQPVRFERCAMARLVPARIRSGGIKHAID